MKFRAVHHSKPVNHESLLLANGILQHIFDVGETVQFLHFGRYKLNDIISCHMMGCVT